MKHIIVITSLLALAGCSSFKLGGVLYCPFGQVCTLSVSPPPEAAAKAASAP